MKVCRKINATENFSSTFKWKVYKLELIGLICISIPIAITKLDLMRGYWKECTA